MSSQLSAPRLHERAASRHLRSIRQSQLATALQHAGEDSKVALYVLVQDGQDPAARLAAAQAVATRHGWTVVTRTFDATGATDPTTRPELTRVLSEIHRGKIHAIVAASRTDISTFDDQYQRLLHLRDRSGGLALAWDEASL